MAAVRYLAFVKFNFLTVGEVKRPILHQRTKFRKDRSITTNKFFGDRSRGVDSVGVENCPLPLTKPVAVNTWLALPRIP